MKYKCPHCHSNTFRLVTEVDGASLAQCLSCGEAGAFTVSTILDASGRARLREIVPFRSSRRPTDRKRTSA